MQPYEIVANAINRLYLNVVGEHRRTFRDKAAFRPRLSSSSSSSLTTPTIAFGVGWRKEVERLAVCGANRAPFASVAFRLHVRANVAKALVVVVAAAAAAVDSTAPDADDSARDRAPVQIDKKFVLLCARDRGARANFRRAEARADERQRVAYDASDPASADPNWRWRARAPRETLGARACRRRVAMAEIGANFLCSWRFLSRASCLMFCIFSGVG